MYYNEQLDYRLTRYKERLREAEHRRHGVDRSWHLYKAWEAVRQAAERLVKSFTRESEPCIELRPACEMGFG
jgi:hypothetical protein